MASKGFLESIMFEEPATTNQNVQAAPTASIAKTRNKKLTGKQRVKAARKSISNAEAASIARSKGAKTAPERALQETVSEMDTLNQKQAQNIVVQKQKSNLNTLMDKVGELPPEKMFSEEGFANAKKLVPSLDRETYFNSIAPNSARRKMLTKQLAALPVGTILPEATKENLKAAGIPEPNKYMSLSVTAPGNTLVGAIQQTAIGQAAAGESRAPLFGAGVALQAKQKSLNEATTAFMKAESVKDAAHIQAMTKLAEQNKPLTLAQKANTSLRISDSLEKNTKTVSTLFEFYNNIQDLSDPTQARETFRVDGGDVIKVGGDHNFQNVRDIGLLYSFIKMLDPDSVVREGEIKISESAKGALQALGIGVNRIFSGETLDDRQREGILSVANTSVLNGSQFLQDRLDLAEKQISEFGLNRDAVINPKLSKMVEKLDNLRSKQGGNILNENQRKVIGQGGQKQQFNVGNIKVEVLPD